MDEREIFLAALEIDSPTQRSAYLDDACAQDDALRERLDALLRVQAEEETFLRKPFVDRDLADPSREGPGTLIGRYKLLEKIGEGGFGVVYMADQRQPVNRRVALKIIKLGMDTKQVIGRFEAERQALALMDHPNIAKVFDGGATETGRPYFVMELVNGIPLTNFCDTARLNTRQRLELFMQVCSAVQHAHQKGIIHRDLKPSNVMVTLHDDKPVPKVIDFGVAKATQQRLTEKTVFTRFQHLIGTPVYMSPEQATFSGLDIDTRSDIYSLGVLLFELLTGTTPLDAKKLEHTAYDELCRIIREDQPPLPSTRISTLGDQLPTIADNRREEAHLLRRNLRGELDWIVMKALERDRSRRYQSAADLADDVDNFLQDRPVKAGRPSRFYLLSKFIRRHRSAVAVGLLVVSTLVAGLAFSTWGFRTASTANKNLNAQLQQTREARDYANRLRYASDMDSAMRQWHEGSIGLARQIVDRQKPAANDPDFRHWEWRFLQNVTRDRSLRQYSGFRRGIMRTSISGDGTTLAIGGVNGDVEVWSLHDHRLVDRFHVGALCAGVSLSHDGSLLAISDFDGRIRVKETGASAAFANISRPTFISMVALSPDGRYLGWIEAAGGEKSAGICRLADAQGELQDVHEIDVAEGWGGSFRGKAVFSRDSRLFVVGDLDGVVRVFELPSLVEQVRIQSHRAAVSALALSGDGGYLATAGNSDSSEVTIRIWDVNSGERIDELTGQRGAIYGLEYIGPQQLISAGGDGAVRIWNLDSAVKETPEAKIVGYHEDEIWGLAVHGATGTVLTGDKTGVARLWKIEQSRSDDFGRIALHDDAVRASFTTNSSRICTVDSGGDVHLWDTNEGKHLKSLGHAGANCEDLLCFSGGIAVALKGGAVRIWNGDLSDSPDTIETALKRTQLLRVTAGSLVVCGTDIRRASSMVDVVQFWNIASKQLESVLEIPQRSSYDGGTRISPNGRTLAIGVPINHIALIDVASGKEFARLDRHELSVSGIAFSPDARLLATASDDGTIRVWNAKTGEQLQEMHPGGFQLSVSFSPDCQRLLVGGSQDATLWDVETGRRVGTLVCPGGDARFSPNGEAILVRGKQRLFLWNTLPWAAVDD